MLNLQPTAAQLQSYRKPMAAAQMQQPQFSGVQQQQQALKAQANQHQIRFGRQAPTEDAFLPQNHQMQQQRLSEAHMLNAPGGYEKLAGVRPAYAETPLEQRRGSIGRTFNAAVQGTKTAAIWGVGTALVALPLAGITAVVGLVPLMHWLLPLAAMMATAPLAVGAIAGGWKAIKLASKH